MAQYSVKTGPLNEAGEDFSVLAGDLGRIREGLDILLSKWPEGMSGLRRQLAGVKDSIQEISKKTRDAGMALYEISDFYTRAERTAFDANNREPGINPAKKQHISPPKIRSSSGVVMFERTILPDWLQMAVLEYEQSQE